VHAKEFTLTYFLHPRPSSRFTEAHPILLAVSSGRQSIPR
jgi:hypothetical protein